MQDHEMLDAELIKEAETEYKRPSLIASYRGLAVAASITMVVLITVMGAISVNLRPASPSMDGSAAMPESAKPSSGNYADGDFSDVVTDHAGLGRYMTNLELIDDLVIKFKLLIINDDSKPVDLLLFGRSCNDLGEVEYAICATSANPEGYKTVLTPTYTVNGEPSDSLPTEKGEYEITVDFGIIKNYDIIWDEKVIIDGKESFKIK